MGRNTHGKADRIARRAGQAAEHLRYGRFALPGGPVLPGWKDRVAFAPADIMTVLFILLGFKLIGFGLVELTT